MIRLIDAEPLENWIKNQKRLSKYTMLMMVQESPTVDAAPVVHGKWEVGMIGWMCSACGYSVMPWNNTPYCPRCGARMDLK